MADPKRQGQQGTTGTVDAPAGGAQRTPESAPPNRKRGLRAPPDETKAERFKRLANKRVPRAAQMLTVIRNLANKSHYEYTPEQATRICDYLANQVKALVDSFKSAGQEKNGWTL